MGAGDSPFLCPYRRHDQCAIYSSRAACAVPRDLSGRKRETPDLHNGSDSSLVPDSRLRGFHFRECQSRLGAADGCSAAAGGLSHLERSGIRPAVLS